MFASFVAAMGGLELFKWLMTMRSARRRAAAEADSVSVDAAARSVRMYEDSILFLQSQLRDKEEAFAGISSRLHDSMRNELELTRRLGEANVKFLSSRCDLTDCAVRRPPLSIRLSRSEDSDTLNEES